MKTLRYLILCISSIVLFSCTDILDTMPYDQLSPATFWKNEDDANSALVACYNNWSNSSDVFFSDVMSDIGYNNSGSSKYKYVGNGSLSPSLTVNYYDYTTIRRCNNFLEKIKDISFDSEKYKKDLIAQVRTIRAYRYFILNYWYGGVPLITDVPKNAKEAQKPRISEDKLKLFIYNELDESVKDLYEVPAELGRIAKGTALAIKMRAALYWGDYRLALDAAKSIEKMNIYELDKDFLKMFSLSGKKSKEIICSIQHVENTFPFYNLIRLYNNQDGGWASMVPTQNLVDMFEMNNGLLITDKKSGYDPIHPFANRDPRLYKTVVYPGQDWIGSDGKTRVVNTLDKNINGKKNTDFYLAANNASKTGLIWAKYTTPRSQYSTIDESGVCPILFRYAEVLLTIAECNVELNENLDEALDVIDKLRKRGGQIPLDRENYSTQNQIRELVRRERCIELAGEGLRRADILRWKTSDGRLLAEQVLNETLYRVVGHVDYTEKDPHRRAVIELASKENEGRRKIEDRTFAPFQRYLPFPQSEIDKNPQLEQNKGYN